MPHYGAVSVNSDDYQRTNTHVYRNIAHERRDWTERFR